MNYDFFDAVKKGDLNKTNVYLQDVEQAKLLVNQIDDENQSPLFYATDTENVEMVKTLLPYYHQTNYIIPSIIKAISLKNKTILSLILSQKNLIPKELIEKIAFYICEKGDKESLSILIHNGLNINAKNADGKTLLEVAIEENNKDIAFSLIEHGIQQTGDEILLIARHAKSNPNSIEMAKKILDFPLKSFNINKKYENGLTPLMSAIQQGNLELATLLIDQGAIVNLTNASDLKAIAYSSGNKTLLDTINQKLNIKEKPNSQTNAVFDAQTEEIEFNEKSNLVKDAGHILGLSHESVDIRLPNKHDFVSLKYEASIVYRSVDSMLKLLKKYLKHNYSVFSNEEQKNFKEIVEIIERMANLMPYESEKINLISSGWSEHAIYLGFYKDNMIVANRGAGKKANETGLNIFHLQDAQKLIKDSLLKDLSNFNSQYDQATILNKIDAVITGSKSTISIKTKDQKHGNCSFVNLKAMVQALLFILKKEALIQNKSSNIEWSEASTQTNALNYAQKEYKKFTNYIRNTFLQKVIKGYKNPKNEEYKNIYKHILVTYLNQHHGHRAGSEEKREKELERVFRILSAFDIKTRMELIETTDNKLKSIGGTELLCAAAQFGNLALVKLLLETGVDINVRNRDGRTPLMLAVIQNRPEIASHLLDHGANPSLIDNSGFSALHHTARLGHAAIADVLVPKLNADDLNRTASGWTPAMLAAINGHSRTLQILSSNIKTDLNITGPNNSTALMIAAASGKEHVVKCLSEIPKVNLLLKTPQGLTAAQLAKQYHHFHIEKQLNEALEIREHRLKLLSKAEWTPLHAAKTGHTKDKSDQVVSPAGQKPIL